MDDVEEGDRADRRAREPEAAERPGVGGLEQPARDADVDRERAEREEAEAAAHEGEARDAGAERDERERPERPGVGVAEPGGAADAGGERGEEGGRGLEMRLPVVRTATKARSAKTAAQSRRFARRSVLRRQPKRTCLDLAGAGPERDPAPGREGGERQRPAGERVAAHGERARDEAHQQQVPGPLGAERRELPFDPGEVGADQRHGEEEEAVDDPVGGARSFGAAAGSSPVQENSGARRASAKRTPAAARVRSRRSSPGRAPRGAPCRKRPRPRGQRRHPRPSSARSSPRTETTSPWRRRAAAPRARA